MTALVEQCPACGKGLRVRVEVLLDLPATMVRKVTKQKLRRRETRLTTVGWDRAVLYCPRGDWSSMLEKGEK